VNRTQDHESAAHALELRSNDNYQFRT
jgi:hypothetical protein